MRFGVRLGIDPVTPGSAWPAATPPGCWRRRSRPCARGKGDLARIAEILGRGGRRRGRRRAAPVAVRRRGSGGGQGARVRRSSWRGRVAPVPVRLCDERLTTVTAEAMLRDRGRKGAKRRAVVDQAAAVVILQHALDTERARGSAPGEMVAVPESEGTT